MTLALGPMEAKTSPKRMDHKVSPRMFTLGMFRVWNDSEGKTEMWAKVSVFG